MFLSPAARESHWVEEEWAAAFYAQVNSGIVNVIPVLLANVTLRPFLQNKKYCDLRTNQLEEMRKLKTFLLGSKPTPLAPPVTSASLPNFTGREEELSELKTRLGQPGSLVPIIGMPGLGKTYLAREFIRRHGALFESVYQLDCEKKDLAALTDDLAQQLGLRLNGEVSQVAQELRTYLSRRRRLLFLDGVEDDQPAALVPEGLASVLLTSRNPTISFFAEYPALEPPLFTDQEALELFQRVDGPVEAGPLRYLFKELGYLPIAIAVSAGLIKHDYRYTVESLLSTLPPLETLSYGKNNIGVLFKSVIGALSDKERRLLGAMATCASGGVRLEFAAEVAGLGWSDSLDALRGLYSRSLVIELDRRCHRYRLHALIREAASPSEEVRGLHARLVRKHLESWKADPLRAADFIDESVQAFAAWIGDTDLVLEIANSAGLLSMALSRLAGASDFFLRVQDVAARAAHKGWLQLGLGNQALILAAWGRLDEAMALHKKEEAICQELGNRSGLSRSYGNQALILKARGRLDEAMALLSKAEATCEELSDRAGLSRTYGNQALILQDWGRLDEAMALHKKEEKICQELGDRAGLHRTFGNQALILKAWNQLAEAMALMRKKEAICRELGDRSSLARTYGNQALIVREWGRPDEALVLLRKQEAICLDLGDRTGLQTSYVNQAEILRDTGRLGGAVALLKKQEAICLDLGDRKSLAHCYWIWGVLAKRKNDDANSTEKLKAALAMFTELRMVRERDAVLSEMKK